MKLEFFQNIFKKVLQILKFIKIHPVRAVLFHAGRLMDRWTAMTKLKVAFHYFANIPNNRK
jgi:hypothetical protein